MSGITFAASTDQAASSSSASPLLSSHGSHTSQRYSAKELVFTGKGNNTQPSKYIIIPQTVENNVKEFADLFLLKGLDKQTDSEQEVLPGDKAPSEDFFPTKPGVLISVTGGAQDFYLGSSKLEQVFNRGLLRAAQNIDAWIIDGGLDAGVMQYVGRAVKEMAVDDVPCIGIASHKMVILNEMLTESVHSRGPPVDYVANISNNPNACALNPNHTHFILVDGDKGWGKEIMFRSKLEEYLRDKFQIPVVLLVVNGGPGTLDTVAQGAEKDFAIVVVEGSGRACDAIAGLVRRARTVKFGKDEPNIVTVDKAVRGGDETVDISAWFKLLDEAKKDEKKIVQWTGFMDRILRNYQAITLFNADGEAAADMDIFILRSILNSPGRKLTIKEKLHLGVVWDREDIVQEVLDSVKDVTNKDEAKEGITRAMEEALLHDRPKIFAILAEKGARKDAVNLRNLYYYKPVKHFFRQIPEYAAKVHSITTRGKHPDASPHDSAHEHELLSEFSRDSVHLRSAIKDMFKAVGGPFVGYANHIDHKFVEDPEGPPAKPHESGAKALMGTLKKKRKTEGTSTVSFSDFLIWAVLVNRMDLAKAIWRKTTHAVHSALLACQLYRFLGDYASDKGECEENADWFENAAIRIMDELDYDDVKPILNYEWAEFGSSSVLEIAGECECKKFVGHAHVQLLLDELFYSDDHGRIEPSTTSFRIWVAILLPLFMFGIYKPQPGKPTNIIAFYALPIIKFWTNTVFYFAFLMVQMYVLVNLNDPNKANLSSGSGSGSAAVSASGTLHLPGLSGGEIVLWVWVVGLAVEEISQLIQDVAGHFSHFSNQMDFTIILLHVVYMVLRWTCLDNERTLIFSAAINTLVVACIFSWGRLLNVFAINHSLGPLFFVITRLFKDIFRWLFLFSIFAVSFQIAFTNISMQAGANPANPYPNGPLWLAFFTIVGDFTYIDSVMDLAPLGIAFLGIYALIAQVMLVNLLIAMMGDTYSNVTDNSTEEWKFFRLELVMENQVASFHPPPINLLILPLEYAMLFKNYLAGYLCMRRSGEVKTLPAMRLDDSPSIKAITSPDAKTEGGHEEDDDDIPSLKMKRKVRYARDEVIEKEDAEERNSVISIVQGLQQNLRTLSNERENDRTFLEKRFKDLGADMAPLQQAQRNLEEQNRLILALLQQMLQPPARV